MATSTLNNPFAAKLAEIAPKPAATATATATPVTIPVIGNGSTDIVAAFKDVYGNSAFPKPDNARIELIEFDEKDPKTQSPTGRKIQGIKIVGLGNAFGGVTVDLQNLALILSPEFRSAAGKFLETVDAFEPGTAPYAAKMGILARTQDERAKDIKRKASQNGETVTAALPEAFEMALAAMPEGEAKEKARASFMKIAGVKAPTAARAPRQRPEPKNPALVSVPVVFGSK